MSHILHLNEQFKSAGHQVRIIAPCSTKKVEELGEDPHFIPVGRPVPIPTAGSVARVALSLRLAAKVKSILRQEKFDVVHLHEPLLPALPITVLRFSEAVNVGTFHAYSGGSLAYFYSRPILKRWFRKLDGKIAVSRPAMEFVSRYFPGYYNIIPNGVDVAHFGTPRSPLPEFSDGKVNILFVGRLEKRKGLKHLLRAYAYLKPAFPDTRLIVVGPGESLRKGYEKSLRKAGLPDVVFTGFVTQEELPRYYQTADIFCAPATGQESFGIVLLEAMAAAKPIVASKIPGYASVVEDGNQGFLVEPKDESALAEALVCLLRDKDLRQAIGQRGWQKVQDYSWKRVAQKVLAYYERLLSESASGGGSL